jgi:hypothetical protein
MTREDIIDMAAQAGINEATWFYDGDVLEKFAALVAAAEREACADLADKCIEDSYKVNPQNQEEANDLKVMRILSEEFAIAIRARGEK